MNKLQFGDIPVGYVFNHKGEVYIKYATFPKLGFGKAKPLMKKSILIKDDVLIN
jgi:hypothetical protein